MQLGQVEVRRKRANKALGGIMIPDFQKIMLPVLKSLADDQIKNSIDFRQYIVGKFNVTEEEQKIKTPSGKQLLLYNRIAWAVVYLKMADLIKNVERGKYKITELGISVLANPPEEINIALLKTFPKFNLNRNPQNQPDEENNLVVANEEPSEKTPDELIESGINQINTELSNSLLEQINNLSPYFFEELVVDLLLKMGYGGNDISSGEVTSKSNDEGIDGIIREDRLGLDKIYIQAKKWTANKIDRPEIQKFVGALEGKRAKKGIFITTSSFQKTAIEYASNVDASVVLIDGSLLTKLMIEYELGVTVENIYKVKKMDIDYFTE